VLGRLVFLIYVNDLPDWIKNDMRMFTNDTKIWSKISGLNDCGLKPVTCLVKQMSTQI